MLMLLASTVNVFADTVNDTKESIQENDFSVLDGDMIKNFLFGINIYICAKIMS